MNKDSSYIGRLFIGTVVANSGIDQTLHQGEVKVYVPELYSEDLSLIPVALYFRNDWGGAQAFGVLSIGRKVILELQDGDPQCPIVRSTVLTPGLLPSEFEAEYPHIYGWADETGNVFLVNKATGLLKFTNAAGFSCQVLGNALTVSSGVTNLTIAGNADVNVTGDTNLTTGGATNIITTGAATVHSTGNLNLISDVKVSISAPAVAMTALMIEEN